MATRSGRPDRRERDARLKVDDTCWICGQPGADVLDHVVPLARGGSNHPSNKRPAHHDVEPKCNRLKGDREYTPIIRRSSSLARPQGGAPLEGRPGRSSA